MTIWIEMDHFRLEHVLYIFWTFSFQQLFISATLMNIIFWSLNSHWFIQLSARRWQQWCFQWMTWRSQLAPRYYEIIFIIGTVQSVNSLTQTKTLNLQSIVIHICSQSKAKTKRSEPCMRANVQSWLLLVACNIFFQFDIVLVLLLKTCVRGGV